MNDVYVLCVYFIRFIILFFNLDLLLFIIEINYYVVVYIIMYFF